MKVYRATVCMACFDYPSPMQDVCEKGAVYRVKRRYGFGPWDMLPPQWSVSE